MGYFFKILDCFATIPSLHDLANIVPPQGRAPLVPPSKGYSQAVRNTVSTFQESVCLERAAVQICFSLPLQFFSIRN